MWPLFVLPAKERFADVSEHMKSRRANAIVLANIVGFGCATAMEICGGFSCDARPVAKLFLVIHLLMTVAFVMAGRDSMRLRRN